jgi:hypothetical protein
LGNSSSTNFLISAFFLPVCAARLMLEAAICFRYSIRSVLGAASASSRERPRPPAKHMEHPRKKALTANPFRVGLGQDEAGASMK